MQAGPMETSKEIETITDYLTGKTLANVGAEANRQAVERLLVEQKGFLPKDIAVNLPLRFTVAGHPYETALDLVVLVETRPFMVIKCAAGSLDSRQKEVVAAARILLPDNIVPYAAASDGQTALVYDAVSGKQIGQGADALSAARLLQENPPVALPEKRREKEYLIFRSYDMMNVNVCRPGQDESG
jgi:hypothetical protein